MIVEAGIGEVIMGQEKHFYRVHVMKGPSVYLLDPIGTHVNYFEVWGPEFTEDIRMEHRDLVLREN
jgi:hypothetical protein